MEEQTLDEFLAKMRKDLDQFEKNWRAENSQDPDDWPMKMGAGDWYEQFLMLDYSGDKDDEK